MIPLEHPNRNAKQTWIFKTEEAGSGEMNSGLVSMVLKDIMFPRKRSHGLKHGPFDVFQKEKVKNTEQEKPLN